jgi:hypothetical protein
MDLRGVDCEDTIDGVAMSCQHKMYLEGIHGTCGRVNLPLLLVTCYSTELGLVDIVKATAEDLVHG